MNLFLWILQSLMAVIFLLAGLFKLFFSKEQLIAKGLTDVKGLTLPLIRLIGILEILGAIGIMLPMYLNILPELTIVSAIGFALIMLAAAFISYNNRAYKKIFMITVVFLICVFIAYARITYETNSFAINETQISSNICQIY